MGSQHGRSRSRSRDRVPRPGAEALEPRTLLSLFTGLVRSDTLDEGETDWPSGPAGSPVVPMAEMMVTQARGSLDRPGDRDALAVRLDRGEVLIASLDDYFTGENNTGTYELSVLGPGGTVLKSGEFEVRHSIFRPFVFDPGGPGQASQSENRLIVEAPQDGTYTVELADASEIGNPSHFYTLGLRTIGLNSGRPDRNFLNIGAQDEIVARFQGERLLLAGPVGIGFALRGEWTVTTETVDGGQRLRYAAGGTVYLQSASGEIPLPVPPGASFVVLTRPVEGDPPPFGEVESIDFAAQVDPFALAAPLNRDLGLNLRTPAGGLSLNSKGYGVKLGRDEQLDQTGAPVNANVPYLFYQYQSGLSVSFGGTEGTTLGGYSWSIVVDPSDIFLYAGVRGIPTALGEFALAVSAHGDIPFRPFARPSDYLGQVFGDVFLRADVDLTKLVGAPVSVDGDLVIDYDVNDDGRILGGAFDDPGAFFASGFDPALLGGSAVAALGDLAIGVNARISVGLEIGKQSKDRGDSSGGSSDDPAPFTLSVPVGEGTLVYDPAAQGIFARGGSVNPFEGTFLEPFGANGQRVVADGFIRRDGTFRFTYTSNYQVLGYRLSGASITIDNNGARAEGDAQILGGTASLTGNIQTNGDFRFAGMAAIDLGIISGDANVTFAHQGSTVTFGASATVEATTDILGKPFGGRLTMSIDVGVSGGLLLYDGSVRGTLILGDVRIGAGLRIYADANEFGLEIDIPGAAQLEDLLGDLAAFFGVPKPDIPDSIRVAFPRGQASPVKIDVPAPLPVPPPIPERKRTPGDFDGDGRADFGIFGYSPDEGFARFAGLTSGGGLLSQPFGGADDVPVSGDFDGDGVDDLAVYGYSPDNGYSRFAVLTSGGRVISQPFGGADDRPVSGDFDGDGTTDFAVYGYSPVEGFSRLAVLLSGGPTDAHADGIISQPFGGAGDLFVSGDYDGDGITDLAVYGYSPDEGFSRFAIVRSSDGEASSRPFGGADDRPVSGDFDGDGITDVAVYGYSPDEGFSRFAIVRSSDGEASSRPFGGVGDLPAVADYDGDGITDVAVYGYSPDEGFSRFAVLESSAGTALSRPFGGPGERAIATPAVLHDRGASVAGTGRAAQVATTADAPARESRTTLFVSDRPRWAIPPGTATRKAPTRPPSPR